MINLKKNDAIADAVRDIMEKELKGNQTKLDKNHNGKLDSQDFKMLRGQKKASEEVEQQDEAMSHQAKTTMKHIPNPSPALKKAAKDIKPGVAGYRDRVAMLKAGGVKEESENVEENAFDYKSPRQPEPNGGSGVKKGSRYGGSKQKEKPEQEEPKEKKEEVRFTLKVMKERYEEPILDELINEVLSKDASAGAWIHDFVHSDNSKFDGKSTAERKKMALGAYYGKQNEENVEEGLKTFAKKAFKALTGGSDEDQRKDLQKKMGVPQTGQKPTQKEEVVVESKGPTSQMDEPFITNAENKPLNNAKELASKTLKRMKSEMLGKAGTSE
jgi:hypothetical protein